MQKYNIFQKAIIAGYSVFPCNGKKPATNSWKKYMKKLPEISEAENWKGNMAVVCGKTSGGITAIDFDIKYGNKFDQWIIDMINIRPELLSDVYIETTPSGGYHVVLKSEFETRSKKIALNKDGDAMIETRGEGGYFICAPSLGYAVYYNQLSKLKTIDKNDAQLMLCVCESYNELEKPEYKPVINKKTNCNSVFDKYDNENDPVELLLKYGWTIKSTKNDVVYLCRPGKTRAVSASWNFIPNRLHVFTTATAFKAGTVYKPYAIYTVLEHNGNFKTAFEKLSENNNAT